MGKYEDAYGKPLEEWLPGKPSVEELISVDSNYAALKQKYEKVLQERDTYQKAYDTMHAENTRLRANVVKYSSLLATGFCEHCREDLLKWQASGAGKRIACIGCRTGKIFRNLLKPSKKRAER